MLSGLAVSLNPANNEKTTNKLHIANFAFSIESATSRPHSIILPA